MTVIYGVLVLVYLVAFITAIYEPRPLRGSIAPNRAADQSMQKLCKRCGTRPERSNRWFRLKGQMLTRLTSALKPRETTTDLTRIHRRSKRRLNSSSSTNWVLEQGSIVDVDKREEAKDKATKELKEGLVAQMAFLRTRISILKRALPWCSRLSQDQ